jgi:predicted P-loop ATPase
MLTDNRTLYELGFHLHWLKPNSKMPVENNWSAKEKKSLKELKTKYREGYNIGTLLGRPLTDGTFLAVIDCDIKAKDPKHRKEMLEKLGELLPSFEEAPIVKSGRGNGSMHVYVRTEKATTPARYSQSTEKVKVYMPSAKPSRFEEETLTEKEIDDGTRLRAAWEISIMGLGQQVVLPPSIHPDSGKNYKWQNSLEVLADIPIVKFNVKDESAKKKIVLEDFKAESVDLVLSDLKGDIVDLIISGKDCEDRSADLMRACLCMVNAGFTDNQILSVLTDKENYLSSAGYEHAQTDSRARAAKWVYKYTLVKAREMTSIEHDFDKVASIEDLDEVVLTEEEYKKQREELFALTHWSYRLERNPRKNGEEGKIKNTLKNLMLILKNECTEGTLKRDQFAQRDFYAEHTPWGGSQGKEITDYDILLMKKWVADNWAYEPSNVCIEEAVALLCGQAGFHPVRDFLDGLEWDGVERLDNWLLNYMGAQGPKKYIREVGRKTLVAMVKRIYEPGCKFDQVLILEGAQGIGKSSAVKILASPWFSDTDLNIGDKDTILAIQSNWVMELGELATMNRAEVDHLKGFVARNVDRIRAPYGKKMQDYPRQSIFIGTTNNDEYLKDKTGNRRYWPVKVSNCDFESLAEDRDQLLAEAKACYELGEPLWLDDESVRKLALIEQGAREERDELENVLIKVLAHNEEKTEDGFTLTELTEWDGEGGLNSIGALSVKTRLDQMRLTSCLKGLGYHRKQVREGNHRFKKWFKKEV